MKVASVLQSSSQSLAGTVPVYPSLFYWSQHSTGHSTYGVDIPAALSGVEVLPPLCLLVVLFLVWPRRLLSFVPRAYFRLMFNFLSTGILHFFFFFFCRAVFLPVRPHTVLMHGVVHPRCTTWYFPLLNFTKFLLAHFSGLFRSLWMATCPLVYQVLLLICTSSANLMMCSILLSRLLTKSLSRIGPQLSAPMVCH